MMRWGLIPSWAKDASGSAQMINARSETAATQPVFRDAMKSRRCLIPADGFYEWKKNGKIKQPYCFEVNDGKLFAFAGLWDRWKNPNGEWIRSCLILTTTPNAVTAPVHDRMPVILNPGDYDFWLDPGMNALSILRDLLNPFAAEAMRSYPVRRKSTMRTMTMKNRGAPFSLQRIKHNCSEYWSASTSVHGSLTPPVQLGPHHLPWILIGRADH